MMRIVTKRWRDGKGPYEGHVVEQYVERIPTEEEQAVRDDERFFAPLDEERALKEMRFDQKRLEDLVDAACDAEGGE